MRARYYDPSNGRFIGEDPAGKGENYFMYCGDNPVSYVDSTGKDKQGIAMTSRVLFDIGLVFTIMAITAAALKLGAAAAGASMAAMTCMTMALVGFENMHDMGYVFNMFAALTCGAGLTGTIGEAIVWMKQSEDAAAASMGTLAYVAVAATTVYMMEVTSAIIACDIAAANGV